MTKKDYIVIARVFNATIKIWTEARAEWITFARNYRGGRQKNCEEKIDGINKILASLNVVVRALSHELLKDNPKFDAQKFATACGLPQVRTGCNDEVISKVAAELAE